jgi:sigma-B regulation protein RsbU (phosphoserine phosphatase)
LSGLNVSREHSEEFQSRFELKTLLDTSRMLIESDNPDFVLNNLLLITIGKLLTPKGLIILRKDKNRMFVAKTKGKTGVSEKDEFECPESYCKSDNPIYTADDMKGVLPDAMMEQGLSTFFTIRTSSRHLGYLCIGAKAGGQSYKENELGFIENLVIISAVAIANSLLISELKDANRQLDQKVQELNTLFDISREFNAMVDRAQMLNVFRFALMGQMFVRKFFFMMVMDGEPQVIIQQGLKGVLSVEEKQRLMEIGSDYVEVKQMSDCPDFLIKNDISALIKLTFQDETAILGIGKRANGLPYNPSDYNFLLSLGSLAFLSIQKTFLMESRIEKEKLEEELSLARTIQNTLFPNPIPVPDGYDIAGFNVPSRHVGGDYFDVIPSGEHNLYLAIADVTGKGIPASLLMANLQAMLHILAPLNLNLAHTTGTINDIIYKNTPSDKFISFFWGVLDLEQNVFRYCNAGHNPPIHVNGETGKPTLLSTGGMLLGALPTMMPYEAGEIKMNPGDVVLMFTDGVSESMNEEEEEYGEERISENLVRHYRKSAQHIMDELLDEVKAFCNNNYGDDLTVLVIRANERDPLK